MFIGLAIVWSMVLLKQRSERRFLRSCLGAGVAEVSCMAKVQIADKLAWGRFGVEAMPETVTLDIRVLGIPEVMQVQRERDELLAALKAVVKSRASAWHDEYDGTSFDYPDDLAKAQALIARIEMLSPDDVKGTEKS
jgi:hypothetical protein